MRIAVIGGGIAGLTAAYTLSRRHEVRLFEAASYLGGHTRTVPVEEDGKTLWIDMGFIVYNERTYPRFTRLLAELGVPTEPTSMSFSVRCERTGLEYNGTNLNRMFAQRSNLFSPAFHRMIRDIVRFNRVAPRLLTGGGGDPTLGEFLERHRFSGAFVQRYLVPMTAAIWSTRPQRMLAFPARSLAAFLDNHGLLSVAGRPQWRIVQGGSKSYVERLAAPFASRVALDTPVEWVRRGEDGVEVKPRAAASAVFDRVVLAVHSDQALALLADPTPAERQVLGAVPYEDNEVVLHTDDAFLPRRRLARASWNYHLGTPRNGVVQVTYYMNQLQRLRARRHYCVTLNRGWEIPADRVLHREVFAHPQLSHESFAAQERWAEINGPHTYFCGAYWGYGFHEDGVASALRAVSALEAGAEGQGRRPRLPRAAGVAG